MFCFVFPSGTYGRTFAFLHMSCRGGSSWAPTGGGGLTLKGGGVVNGDWVVGWTVELKLNREKRKNWIPTGG